MPFTPQDFRSQLQLDGARPNLFEVSFVFPLVPGISNTLASQKTSIFCKAAQLPGSTINPVIQHYFGRELKFAGNRVFSEWTVTIVNDEDFIIRNAFERWSNAMNSHVGNLRNPSMISGDGGYQVDADVWQYGKAGDKIKNYKFIGMFPIDISPIELDWGANDTIEEFAVTLAYQWWESNTTERTTAQN